MSDLITKQEGELRLSELKGELLEGMHMFEKGITKAAIAIYRIREEGVWQYDKEFQEHCDSCNARPIWNNWVIWFSNEADFKRSTILEWVSALRVLEGGCEIPVDVVETYGIDLAPLVQLKRSLDYSTKTGEIYDARDEVKKNLPPGNSIGERVAKFVLETHELPNPSERRNYVDQVTHGDDYEPIGITILGPDHIGRYNFVVAYHGRRYAFGRDAMPSHLVEQLCREKRLPMPKE